MAQVYDLRNKVVAATAPVEPPIRWIAATGAGCIDIGEVAFRVGAGGLVTRAPSR